MDNILKILVAYHKPSELIPNKYLIPINTGRSTFLKDYENGIISDKDYNWVIANTVPDNTGDNISAQSDKYCELTTIYWAWKNYAQLGNPKYIGFMHYRRHFIFDDISKFDNTYKNCVVPFNIIDADYINTLNYSDETFNDICNNYDFICCNAIDDNMTIYEYFKKNHQIEELDFCIDVIKEDFPDLLQCANEYLHQNTGYYCNMFIMKKDLFFEYCNLIFHLTNKMIAHFDYSNYSKWDTRFFVLERITGVYLYYLMKYKKLKFKTYPISLIKDTSIQEELYPTFESNNVAILFTADDDYIKYIGVTIESIIENSSVSNNYDIYILTSSINEDTKRKLNDLIKNRTNFSIKYLDFNHYAALTKADFSKIYNETRFSGGTYYRMWTPIIFKNFEKILYLDSDLVVEKDIAELYSVDLSNNLIAGVRDTEYIRLLYKDNQQSSKFLEHSKELNLDSQYNYIQAGVLLFNIKEMNKNNFFEKFIDVLNDDLDLFNMDQDIINYICNKRITYLDAAWNVEWHCTFYNDDLSKVLPSRIYKDYIRARENPYIIHYASWRKPWQYPEKDLAYYFWKYARNTLFYEEIIYDNQIKQKHIKKNKFKNKLFSIRCDEKHRIITILGVRIKTKLKPICVLPHLEVHLVDHCNLNCKSCSHFCNIAPKTFLKVKDFEHDLKVLSNKFQINRFFLMGGEPLLHPDIEKFVKVTRKYLTNTDIYILSNGILIEKMPDSFFQLCHKNNIKFSFSKYPINLNWEKIFKKLDSFGITYISYDTKSFYAFHNPKGNSNPVKAFNHCKHRFGWCYNLRNKKLYTCPRACFMDYFNSYFNENIPQPKGISIYEDATNIIKYLKKPIKTCKFCNVITDKYLQTWEKSTGKITKQNWEMH